MLRRGAIVFNSTARQLGLIASHTVPSLLVSGPSVCACVRVWGLLRITMRHWRQHHLYGKYTSYLDRQWRAADQRTPLLSLSLSAFQDHSLPTGAPAPCRLALRQLLMLPPPPEQAAHIRAAVRLLARDLGGSPPALGVELTADLIARVLEAREASHAFFLTLVGAL